MRKVTFCRTKGKLLPRKRYGNAGAMCMGGDGGGLRSLFGRGGRGDGRAGRVCVARRAALCVRGVDVGWERGYGIACQEDKMPSYDGTKNEKFGITIFSS